MYLGFYIKNALHSYFIDVATFKNFNLDSTCNTFYCIFTSSFIKGYRSPFMPFSSSESSSICVSVAWISSGSCWLVRMLSVGSDSANPNFFPFSLVVRNRWHAAYILNRTYNFSSRNALVWHHSKPTLDYMSLLSPS